MGINRSGSQPSSKAPAANFTGTVWFDLLFQARAPARAKANIVTFEPGARTDWRTHPLGQTLIIMSGCGLQPNWGEPVEEVRPGDVVCFPPGTARRRPPPCPPPPSAKASQAIVRHGSFIVIGGRTRSGGFDQ
jgi:quercetin dioxygenase-like cupin family protein